MIACRVQFRHMVHNSMSNRHWLFLWKRTGTQQHMGAVETDSGDECQIRTAWSGWNYLLGILIDLWTLSHPEFSTWHRQTPDRNVLRPLFKDIFLNFPFSDFYFRADVACYLTCRGKNQTEHANHLAKTTGTQSEYIRGTFGLHQAGKFVLSCIAHQTQWGRFHVDFHLFQHK